MCRAAFLGRSVRESGGMVPHCLIVAACLLLRVPTGEQAARAARKGLWGDANPVLPWERRKREILRRGAKKGVGVGR